MNIVTVCNDKWNPGHLERWLYYTKKNVPNAKLHVLYAGEKDVDVDVELIRFKNESDNRPWYNSVRMGACNLFGIPEFLYVDTDVDILEDLNDICNIPGDILWTRSPVLHPEWIDLSDKIGYDLPEPEANNGFFYMRGDFLAQYTVAEALVDDIGMHPRIRGTAVFNVMLRENNIGTEIAQDYHRIWWEADSHIIAKSVHYCNDHGQEKRLHLEKIRRAM